MALLGKSFKASDWTSQEIGIAYALGKATFIPLSLDETCSFGFISHVQSEPIRGRPVDSLLFHPLLTKYPKLMFPRLVATVRNAGSFRHAEDVMRPIVEYFGLMDREVAQDFAEACVENGQVWSANLCRNEYIPEFLHLHAGNLTESTREALDYQLTEQTWFQPGTHERH